MRRLSIALLLLAAACARPLPPAPVPPDAADAARASDAMPPDPTGCTAACANLQRLGCPEGIAANCVATCQHGLQITNMNTACLAAAGSPDAARACGSLGPSGCTP
jgi:hypothetical protein